MMAYFSDVEFRWNFMNFNCECRLLTTADLERMANIMSEAFVDDPLYAFMLPNKKTRLRSLNKIFIALSKVNIEKRRAFGVGEPLVGVAYLRMPSRPDMKASMKSPSNFLRPLLTPFPFRHLRARVILKKMSELYKLYADEPHFYLEYIGVLPSAQGQGVASKLIRPLIEKADSEGVIVYLETVNRSNVALYQHYGFQCMEEATVPGTGVTIWAMRRPVHKNRTG
jgi:ribosomal protein S18 acetylase RimI-like enzyme